MKRFMTAVALFGTVTLAPDAVQAEAPTKDIVATAVAAGRFNTVARALTAVLTYHVVSGKVMAAQVVGMTEATSVQGGSIAIVEMGGKVMLNNRATVTVAFGQARNPDSGGASRKPRACNSVATSNSHATHVFPTRRVPDPPCCRDAALRRACSADSANRRTARRNATRGTDRHQCAHLHC